MRIGICGYGNLGRGCERAALAAPDMELAGIFTRREPTAVHSAFGTAVYPAAALPDFRERIDVLLLCGGSATDLWEMTPRYAADFCVLDSFDTHARMEEHFARVDAAARAGGHTALIGIGWDPGLFSLMRLFADVLFPDGKTYTFWGPGVSQGHSDAIRRLPGAADARAYTYPDASALAAAERGEGATFPPTRLHRRVCYVVPEPGADLAALEKAICTIPGYFAGCETEVYYINKEEMQKKHAALPHGGRVIARGDGSRLSLLMQTASNPDFTGRILLAYARAARKMQKSGATGCKTVWDVPPSLLSPCPPEKLRKSLL